MSFLGTVRSKKDYESDQRIFRTENLDVLNYLYYKKPIFFPGTLGINLHMYTLYSTVFGIGSLDGNNMIKLFGSACLSSDLLSGNFSPISSTVSEAVLTASPIQFRARQE